jgi:hypothetical protein
LDSSQIGKRSKRKGKHYETRVAQLLTTFTNKSFRRVPCSGGFNKSGGLIVAKQIFTGDVFCDDPTFIFSVEAKNRADISLTALLKSPASASLTKYWFQCLEDATINHKLPILFFKPNVSDDWICLRTQELTILNLTKAIRMDFQLYNEPIELTIVLRDTNGKKIKTQKKIVSLPNFSIMDWNEFIKYVSPSALFS